MTDGKRAIGVQGRIHPGDCDAMGPGLAPLSVLKDIPFDVAPPFIGGVRSRRGLARGLAPRVTVCGFLAATLLPLRSARAEHCEPALVLGLVADPGRGSIHLR